MRIVHLGTKDKLYRLQPEDLPEDNSLKGSFFKWVDLSGFDLSGYDMQFVSTADCVAHNVILGDIEYLYSRRTDWAGSKVPPLVSSLSHDLVLEVMRQHKAPSGSPAAATIEWVIEHVGASYHNSWGTSIWHQVMVVGLAREQFKEHLTCAFADYPRLMNRLNSELTGELRQEPPTYTATKLTVQDPRPMPTDMAKVYGRKTYSVPLAQFKADDIWGAARDAEQYLGQLSGIGGWKVVVFSLEPFVLAHASHNDMSTNEEVWWSKGMGR